MVFEFEDRFKFLGRNSSVAWLYVEMDIGRSAPAANWSW